MRRYTLAKWLQLPPSSLSRVTQRANASRALAQQSRRSYPNTNRGVPASSSASQQCATSSHLETLRKLAREAPAAREY